MILRYYSHCGPEQFKKHGVLGLETIPGTYCTSAHPVLNQNKVVPFIIPYSLDLDGCINAWVLPKLEDNQFQQ